MENISKLSGVFVEHSLTNDPKLEKLDVGIQFHTNFKMGYTTLLPLSPNILG